MFTKKISVIIPAYNIENLIEKCLESVCGQTYPKELMEIIVVDDGSTDGTLSRIQEFAKGHDNIIVIHQENGGSSKARNHGLSVATGDYLGFVDADDYIDPCMYEELMKAALEGDGDGTPFLMVQASRDEIAENGERLPDVCIPPSSKKIITGREHLRTLLMHTGDASFCTKLTSRELFTGICKGFPEDELNEDFYLMVHMLKRVEKLAILPGQYYHVFYRTGSNSRKRNEQKDYFPPVFTDIVRNSDVAYRLVDKDFPELREVAVRFCLFQRLDYLLHIPISRMTKDNAFYNREVVGFLRKHFGEMLSNKYLTGKNKAYLTLFAIAPKGIRKLHAKLKGIDY